MGKFFYSTEHGMFCVNFVHELPETVLDGTKFRVGLGTAWRVFRFNSHQGVWLPLYWAT